MFDSPDDEREFYATVYNAAHAILREADRADARTSALMEVHLRGWTLVAQALRTGLAEVAEAIRRSD